MADISADAYRAVANSPMAEELLPPMARAIGTIAEAEVLLSSTRALNAFLLGCFLYLSALLVARRQGRVLHWSAPLALASSYGFLLFSHNLYFLSALMFFPAFLMSMQKEHNPKIIGPAIFFASALFFLKGYEFATTFALLNFLVAVITLNDSLRKKIVWGFQAFSLTVAAFFFALLAHASLISSSFKEISIDKALSLILSTVGLRMGSTNGVPIPFSQEFYSAISLRLAEPAFSLVFFEISQGFVFLIMAVLGGFFWKQINLNARILLLGSPVVYLSWYIFAYQHIMWHPMYDWYLFATSVVYPLALVCANVSRRDIKGDPKGVILGG
jgi:hypothetical protein